MEVVKTDIEGLLIIVPEVFHDDRGHFLETYNRRVFNAAVGKELDFVQDNESRSSYGVIRGLHYQLQPHSQTKLVRVTEGEVYDVAVDLRKGSPTFGRWKGVVLSSENMKQLLIPEGFAHGYSVLSEEAVFHYKCDDYYHPELERGIAFDDPTLAIDWKVENKMMITSPKDRELPKFQDAEHDFHFKAGTGEKEESR